MVKIVTTLIIGALLGDAVWCRLEIHRLEGENRRAGEVLVQLNSTNQHFETALLSCRYAMDAIRDTAERRLVERLNTDIGQYRYLRDRNSTKDFAIVAKTLRDTDALQVRQ